ncbi:DNA cytosine methyltransferase [Streptomyces sp. NPDC059786]|uniref:DNA cytosine methyltransferase n=1 Tax=Streptomyces sp. NPDC059786 TaxID=3346946 RepID=UPI00364E929A
MNSQTRQKGIVLDFFAGPGGWSEGLRMLGLQDIGLEWDEAACKTRTAAGHTTVRVDVSAFVLTPVVGRVWGAIFSPPCTKFSAAGKQFGMRVLGLLAEGIQRMFRGDDCRQELRDRIYPAALVEQKAANDRRRKPWTSDKVEAAARDDAFITVLVLEPARCLHALIAGDTSGGIPLEWAAFEQVPGVLPLWKVYAEELRALGWSVWTGILNAANYGVPQTRERAVLIASSVRRAVAPDATHGKNPVHDLFGDCLKPWVTMAEALGLDRRGVVNTRGDRKTPGGNNFPVAEPSWALTEKARSWILHTNRDQKPDGTRQTTDPHTAPAPAPALTSKSGGQWVLKHNARANATVRSVDEPAATLAFGHARNEYEWINTRPATTVCATNRIAAPGHRDRSSGGESQFAGPETVRITVPEAAVLQSFPADYPWQGTRTKQFEQVGNAWCPRAAAAVVGAATGIDWQPPVARHYGEDTEVAA